MAIVVFSVWVFFVYMPMCMQEYRQFVIGVVNSLASTLEVEIIHYWACTYHGWVVTFVCSSCLQCLFIYHAAGLRGLLCIRLALMWCLEAVPHLKAALRLIFTALVFVMVLDFGALAPLSLSLIPGWGAESPHQSVPGSPRGVVDRLRTDACNELPGIGSQGGCGDLLGWWGWMTLDPDASTTRRCLGLCLEGWCLGLGLGLGG